MVKRLVLCSCAGTQDVRRDELQNTTELECSALYTSLCHSESEKAYEEIEAGDVIIACGQETARFSEFAQELDVRRPEFVDLRDRAGWSRDGESKTPKMAALLADHQISLTPEKTFDVLSEGTCFIFGKPEAVLRASSSLKDALSVTALFSHANDVPQDRGLDVMLGHVNQVKGALGDFEVSVNNAQLLDPAGRGDFGFSAPQAGGVAQCDLIIDLSGEPAKVTAPEKREGYLRADPKDPYAVGDLMLEASQMVGVFEKPLYVRLSDHLCAHSRAGKSACSNCLDVCPTGAITSSGDHIDLDPMICAGCGGCSAVCPSGAISYDAPSTETTFRRLSALTEAYFKAGGKAPRLLVIDTEKGSALVAMAARHFDGLPSDTIPLSMTALASFGHSEIVAAIACGFVSVDILIAPNTERDAFEREVPVAEAIIGEGRVRLLQETDPEALCATLQDRAVMPLACDPIHPIGSRRQITRIAAQAINGKDAVLTLPDAAPYGAVNVDTDACTLCLACASLCPSAALMDNPDRPELLFQEDACLQCGLCSNVCPEDAIAYIPRLNLTDEALSQVVLNEEDPFACIECGSLFGVKSTVERILEKLSGKHSMFSSEKAAQMIQMCDNCRVNAQFHSQDNPFSGGERPRVRTSDDYFSDRKDH
ncbi:MAG: 4Fe-4S binding protein [Paracoccaceae bacterium]|nr:4Fe-4S binding protein [Paracoccaceae bacterium]